MTQLHQPDLDHLNISGDPHQLGPVVSSRFAKDLGLSLSPLERLMKTSLYSKKKELGYNPMIITKLLDNYRSNEAILEIPNKFFYDKELRCCADKSKPNVSNRLKWLPSKDFPIVFHHVQQVSMLIDKILIFTGFLFKNSFYFLDQDLKEKVPAHQFLILQRSTR